MTTYQIEKINAFIDKNYMKKNIITQIANDYYYQYPWLLREYKKITGRTINSYIVEKRLDDIKRNIESGKNIIESVKLAGCCSTGSQSYSITAKKYKERFGETFKETKRRAEYEYD